MSACSLQRTMRMFLAAGILAMPAAFVICAPLSCAAEPQPHGLAPNKCNAPELAGSQASDCLSTPILERILAAPWNERRIADYTDASLDHSAQLRAAREDTEFDAWLAARARREGIKQVESAQTPFVQRRNELEREVALRRLAARQHPSPEEIAQAAKERRWADPIPEAWEVQYIFIDSSKAKNPAEQEAAKKRADQVFAQLTPENFADMARLWSDAPSSAEGGVLGSLTLDGYGPTFSAQIKQTPPGTIGGPYPTKSGWNIFYVRSHRATQSKPISKADWPSMTAEIAASRLINEAASNPHDWRSLLDSLGATTDTLILSELAAFENYLLAKEYISTHVASLVPSESDLRAFHNQYADSFQRPIFRHAREILVTAPGWPFENTREGWMRRFAVRNHAREVRERILKGEDFSKVAREVSAADSATSGGDLGWVPKPSGYLIDTALDALKPGEVSPPLMVEKGFWLLQLVATKPREPKSFEEARSEVEQAWRVRNAREMRARLLDEFRQRQTAPGKSSNN